MRIGCQGWNYDDWVTPAGEQYVFYPEGTRQKDMLTLYSSVFDTVEVDSTFYASPTESVFESWFERSPDDFVFSLKFPRSITHDSALRPECYEAAELSSKYLRAFAKKLGDTWKKARRFVDPASARIRGEPQERKGASGFHRSPSRRILFLGRIQGPALAGPLDIRNAGKQTGLSLRGGRRMVQ